MPASLTGPFAKLDRAYEHLRVLDAETAAFYEGSADEGQPYEVQSEFRADTSEYVFTIKVLRQPPARLGLILGDYIHNLRSALDHLVCQLARLSEPSDDCTTTQFPIRKSRQLFDSVEPDWLRGVDAKHRARIEQAQPYNARERARDHALSIIEALDNFDKHRAIHPAFGFFRDPGLTGAAALRFAPNRDAGVIRRRKIANGRRIKGDTEIVWLKLAPLGPNPKVDMHSDLTFEPAFGDEWLKGTALPQLARYVESLIAEFRVYFP
jgi:hypothetical protein